MGRAQKTDAVAKLAAVLRITLGLLFAAAGFLKLLDSPEYFAAAIEKYEIISHSAAVEVAAILPWAELMSGMFFSLGLCLRISFWIIGGIVTMFLGATSWALIQRLPISSCGCFGHAWPSVPLPVTWAFDLMAWIWLAYHMRRIHLLEQWSLDRKLR